jgi:hypothetical protein
MARIDEIDLSGKATLEQIAKNGMSETAGPCAGPDQSKACGCKKSLKAAYRHVCLATDFRDRLMDPGRLTLRCDKLDRGIGPVFEEKIQMGDLVRPGLILPANQRDGPETITLPERVSGERQLRQACLQPSCS